MCYKSENCFRYVGVNYDVLVIDKRSGVSRTV